MRDKSFSLCIASSGQLQAYFLFYFRAVYCYWPDNGRHSINSCIKDNMQHMHVESLTVNLWKVSQRSKSTPIFPKVSRILSKQDQSWTDCWSELFFFLASISLKLLASMPYYIITFYFYPFNQLTIKLETEGYNCYHCINLLHKIKLLWRSIFFYHLWQSGF